jgi:hypothetical protein
MKKLSLGLLLIAFFLVTAPLFAQSSITQANVPFDFVVGKQVFPAGQYTVEFPSADGLMVIHGAKGQTGRALTFRSSTPANLEEGKWVFVQYGETYFLSEVAMPGGSAASKLPIDLKHMAIAKDTMPKEVNISAGTR